jgi:hypothetical protein
MAQTLKGVIYIAYGAPAIKEAEQSIETLRRFHDWPVICLGESGQFPPNAEYSDHPDLSGGYPGRMAKVSLAMVTPFDQTLFLDADTRVRSSALSVGFDILSAGWDMVMVASQFGLSHLSEEDRLHTLDRLLHSDPLQINTGVIWFNKNEEVISFFKVWRKEWKRFKHRDQGAFLRTLHQNPIKLFLLGYPFNSSAGAVVNHRFGQADRGCRK